MAETSNTGTAAGLITDGLLTTAETEHQVEGGLLLDVVVSKCASILELLASKDKPLLVRGDALLVLDLGLDVVNGVRRLHLKGDGLAGEGLHKDLHLQKRTRQQGKCLAVNKQNYIKQTATIYSNRYQQVMCVHHIISTKHAIFQVHRSKGKEHS
jgi:hypothetical protein